MKASTATVDECDGNYKSKSITVFGNATIVEQKGLGVQQRNALEMMTFVSYVSKYRKEKKNYLDSLSPHALVRGKLLMGSCN